MKTLLATKLRDTLFLNFHLLSRDYVFFSLGRVGKFVTKKTLSKVDIEPTTDFLPYTGGGEIFDGLTVLLDIGLLQMISSI